jgi:hypothetical protein
MFFANRLVHSPVSLANNNYASEASCGRQDAPIVVIDWQDASLYHGCNARYQTVLDQSAGWFLSADFESHGSS